MFAASWKTLDLFKTNLKAKILGFNTFDLETSKETVKMERKSEEQ